MTARRFFHFGRFVLRTPLLPFEPKSNGNEEADRIVQAGIGFASYSLSAALERELPAKEALRALERYRLRAQGRATPFGIFAGISSGTIESRSSIQLAPRAVYKVVPLGDGRTQQSDSSALYRNGSLYLCQGRLRFYARHRGRYMLRQAAGERLPGLWERGSWSDEIEARSIFEKSADEDPAAYQDAIAELCEAGIIGRTESSPAAAPRAERHLSVWWNESADDTGNRVDLLKPTETASLSAASINNLCDGIELVARLAAANETPLLRNAKRRFLDRFGGAWVELMRALDNDVGIGFERMLGQRGGDVPNTVPPMQTEPVRDGSWETQAEISGPELVRFPDDILARLGSEAQHHFGATFAVNTSLFLDRAGVDHLIVNGLAGSPGERLFSRFAKADRTIASLIDDMRRFEQDAGRGALLAELECPVVDSSADFFAGPDREASIYFLFPKASTGLAIPANDLALAIEDGQFVLKSMSSERRISPRVSTSHNIHYQSHPAYVFLSLLSQGAPSLERLFGARSAAGTRPRVQFRNIILQRAGWRLAPDTLARTSTRGDLERLRDRLALPDRLLVNGRSGPLALDIGETGALDFLHSENDGRFLEVAELAPEGMIPGVRSVEGYFWNEILVPLGDRSASTRAVTRGPDMTSADVDRWLFHRIDADAGMFEAIVAGLVQVLNEHRAENWHFVRYRENGCELRLRAEIPPALHERYRSAAGARLEDFRSAEWLTDWHLAPFAPEWSRYLGAEGFKLAASIFTLDADLFFRTGIEKGDIGERIWMLADILLPTVTMLAGTSVAAGAMCERIYRARNRGSRFTRGYRAALAAFYQRGAASLSTRDLSDIAHKRLRDIVPPHATWLEEARNAPTFTAFSESIIHMACNRWFPLDDRNSENALIYVLNRRAQKARYRLT